MSPPLRDPRTSNTERVQALDPCLNHYNNERIHTDLPCGKRGRRSAQ